MFCEAKDLWEEEPQALKQKIVREDNLLKMRLAATTWRREEDLNLRRLLTSHDFQSCALDHSAISASYSSRSPNQPVYDITFFKKKQEF